MTTTADFIREMRERISPESSASVGTLDLLNALDRMERLEWFKEASEFLHNHAWSFWWTIQCGDACKEARATYEMALREAEGD